MYVKYDRHALWILFAHIFSSINKVDLKGYIEIVLLFCGEFYWDIDETKVNFIWFYYYSVITFYNFSFNTYFKPFVLFLRYCEYELLQRIFEDEIVFYIAGVAIVKALLKSLFPDGLLRLTFKGSFSLVN